MDAEASRSEDISRLDVEFYRAHHPDLSLFSPDEARQHYIQHGIYEERAAYPAAVREHFINEIPPELSALEIGPFDCPMLRGEHVRYADVLSMEGLQKRAAEHGRNPEGCPYIDYVLTDMDLTHIPDKFHSIASAHCIEHQPDLIQHLQSIEKLLLDGGRYYVVVPDKRYCFDHFITESTIADVVLAHSEERKLHTLKNVIEFCAFSTHNDAWRHWNGDHGELEKAHIARRTRDALELFEKSGDSYIDVHAWRFTPASFRLICDLIADLGYSRLRPTVVHPTPRGRLEFCAVLELQP